MCRMFCVHSLIQFPQHSTNLGNFIISYLMKTKAGAFTELFVYNSYLCHTYLEVSISVLFTEVRPIPISVSYKTVIAKWQLHVKH